MSAFVVLSDDIVLVRGGHSSPALNVPNMDVSVAGCKEWQHFLDGKPS